MCREGTSEIGGHPQNVGEGDDLASSLPLKWFSGLLYLSIFLLPLVSFGQTTFITDDWESGTDITGWTEGTGSDWISSTTNAINGTYSLKHNLSGSAGESYIYQAQTGLNLATATTTWQFQVSNGNWDPSGGNRFNVWIASNETDLDYTTTADGYSVGVNLTGTSDAVCLYKVTNGVVATTLITSTQLWDANDLMGIQVTRTTAGGWELFIDPNGGFDALVSEGTATNTDYTDASYFGLAFDFSSTRAGLLNMDDIDVTQPVAACSAEPTVQAVDIVLSNVTDVSIDISWTAGTGGDNYIVVVSEADAVTFSPTDNADYTGDIGGGDYSSATDQGSGDKVIFDGSGTSTTVTGLSLSTTYYFQVYHYCENGGTEDYMTSDGSSANNGSQNETTAAGSANVIITEVVDASTWQASFVEIYNAGPVAQDITGWQLFENGALETTVGSVTLQPCEYLVFIRGTLAQLETLFGTYNGDYYIASAGFVGNGSDYFELKDGSDVVQDNCAASGSTTASDKAYERNDASTDGATLASHWTVMADRDNATPGEVNVLTLSNDNCAGSCTAPTTQPTGPTFSSVTVNSMNIAWAGGDGNGTIVVVKAGSAVTATPTNGTAHTANTVFGSGDDVGTNEYVVYRSTGANVTVTGLTNGVTYHYAIFEYNTTDDCYLLTSPLTGSQATLSIDSDSEVQTSGTLTEPATISSLDDSNTEWKDVFDFTFADLGTADGLASILDQFLITQGSANAVADWTDAIAGARINGPDQTNMAGTVNATNITFAGANFISVADGASEVYTLSIYLNTDLSAISDNDVLEFKVAFGDITPDAAGSSFGAGSIESGNTNVAIDIAATKLVYTTIPSVAQNATNFTVVVSATDVNGNVDTDATCSTTLALASGAGTLSSATGLTQSLVSGVYTWTDVQHNTDETITIEAQCASLTNITSGNIVISTDLCDFSDDFDRTNSTTVGGGWTETGGDAEVLSNELILETGGANGVDYVVQDVNASYETTFDNLAGTLTWEFNMRHTRTNPSGLASSNYGAAFILGTTSATFTTGSGYAVTHGNSGTTDNIELVHYSSGGVDGTLTQLLASGDYGDEHLSVRVTFSSITDTWELFVRDDGGSFADPSTLAAGNSQGTVVNTTHTSTDLIYSGCYWAHASGASDQAEFDNICVVHDGVDTDSESSTPASQVAAGNISSLDDTDPEAVDVFKFDIDDLGSGDAKVTKVTNIRIMPHSTNTADWTDHIQGVKLDAGGAVTIGTPTITDTEIDIPITAGNLDIADGGSTTVTLSVYLNTSNIVDGDILSFMIDANPHGWTSDGAGSAFNATFSGGDFNSNDFTITVVATELRFVQEASTTEVSQVMVDPVTVEATDANGNRDLGFTSDIRITSTGTLTGTPVDVTAVSGLATFSTLTHTVVETSRTLNAERTSTTDWDVTSTGFDITIASIVLMSWDFSGDAGSDVTMAADFTAANVSSSAPSSGELSRGAGLTAAANADSYGATNWGTSDLATAISNNDYFEWGIAPSIGYTMILTRVEFNWERSSTGPDELTLRSSKDGYVSNLGTITGLGTTGNDEAIGLSGFDDLSDTITFRLYGYSATSAAGAGRFDGSGDDLEILGTVSPCAEPSTQSSSIVFSNQAGCSMTVCFTKGDGDGRVVLMNTSNSFSNPSDGSDPSANSTYSSGEQVVFNGSDSCITVDGLSTSTTYWFRVYEYNCAGGGIDFITSTATNNPLSGSSSTCSAPGTEATAMTFTSVTNTSMHVNWTNGDGTYRIIVCEATTAIGGTPTNSTTYTADQTFNNGQSVLNAGEYIVYSGTGDNFTLLGLSASTTYNFKVFEYNCATGCEVYLTAAPLSGSQATSAGTNPTILTLGDLMVLGLCSNTKDCIGGSSGDDEISFVCFVDLTEGTVLELTDNGYEREIATQWGNSEGVIQATRTGATIPAGTVITFRFSGLSSGTYTSFSPDASWTITEIHGLGSDLIMNSGGDQIFIMQGGTWTYGTSGDHNATITSPNILFGFNSNDSWTALDSSTQESSAYPGLDCFSMMPDAGASDYLKYTGDLSIANQAEWLDRINTSSNWTPYTNCTDYYEATPQYHDGYTILIDNGGFVTGEWSGSRSTDWFNCGNWKHLNVPDATVDVVFPTGSVTNECTIGAPPSGYTEAAALSVTINTGRTLTIDDASSIFEINTNYTNNATLTHTAGVVRFIGSAAQALGGTSASTFEDLTINSTSGTGVTLGADANVNGVLTLTDGFLLTSSTDILTLNDGATATSGSAASFVDGPMNKIGDDAFTFPTGDGSTWARIGISDPGTDVTTAYQAEYFASAHSSSAVTGVLNNVSTIEYWTLDQTATTDDVQVKLYWESDVFSDIDDCDGTPDDLRVAHWNGSAWEVNIDAVTITGACAAGPSAGTVETNSAQPDYSPFTFSSKGSGQNPLGSVLPIQLLYFDAAYNSSTKEVDLVWATLSETNNDYFTIEKSPNGHDFEEVVSQPGAGTTNGLLEYEDIDHSPSNGLNYYRLKQTDYDGQFEYSDMVAVNVHTIEYLKIWPNPANDFVEISFGSEAMLGIQENITNCVVKMYNAKGQLLYNGKHESGLSKLKLDVANLNKGLYIVTVSVNGETYQVKFNK